MERPRRLFTRFVYDENGQDLIEYGLLLSIVGISAVIVLQALPGRMGTAFLNWELGVYNHWIPDPP